MSFFGIYFLTAPTPEKPVFDNYLRSRHIIGIAILVLAANYSVHFFYGIRFVSVKAAISMNLSTYFLSYFLFSSALIALLDRFYWTVRRFVAHMARWILFTVLSGIILLVFPENNTQKIGLLIMASWLFIYGMTLAYRLIKRYHKAVRLFDDTYSDHIGAYIHWMSIFTYWAVIYGISCGLLTFLPDKYIYLWVISSIPFYIYLFCSYMNYQLFYEQVENMLETERNAEQIESEESGQVAVIPSCYAEIEKKLSAWIDSKGYVSPGLTIRELSDALHTNRTYLSAYIKATYNVSFRHWITGLRLEYAKQLLILHPELTIAGISEMSGFLSQSYFTKIFKEQEGYSPDRWRRTQA
ncbi:MAG: helix-turn-helix transcriptional regulator [Parabacteroides sp.]|nr:helix-turn-helix transcriptional regulator [Parabacteroides sp.]